MVSHPLMTFMFCGAFCGLLYLGRTKHTMCKRIGEHHRLIEESKDKRSVPCPFAACHGKKNQVMSVLAIKHIPKGSLTDNETFLLLFRGETFWI